MNSRASSSSLRLFLCGDVMTGRGIDQVLPHPCDPLLHEDYARSARDYVLLAERANGPIPRPLDAAAMWGAALDEFERARPDVRIINLETALTRSDDYAPKGINYRMSPENAACLSAANIDCCALANNHVLDWGRQGLLDTLDRLRELRIATAGAGRKFADASAPAILPVADKRRVLIFSFATGSSGTPREWAGTAAQPGINFLADLSTDTAAQIADLIQGTTQPNDIVVVSIHWGPNWGYDVPAVHRRFAHALIDRAGISVVHGHSSHHPKAIEVYRDRLILYGCGDFMNDYEGIAGYEKYRGDLVLMYFIDIIPTTGELKEVCLVPLQIKRFQLARAAEKDVHWIRMTLERESSYFGAHFAVERPGQIAVHW